MPDYRSIGHIGPGLVTYFIGLIWLYNTNYDFAMLKRLDKKFETKLFFGSIFNFENKFLRLLNATDTVVGLIFGIFLVILFIAITEYTKKTF